MFGIEGAFLIASNLKTIDMKANCYKTLLGGILITSVLFSGCQKTSDSPEAPPLETSAACGSDKSAGLKGETQMSSGVTTSDATSPYGVHLSERYRNPDGTWTWVWAVKNPKPGNGQDNGTVQDLSHWDISLGECMNLSNIVSAATSTNNTDWQTITPELKVDAGLKNCLDYTKPVIKFDYGTSSENNQNTRYFKLVINQNVPMAQVETIYKSGNTTGCGVIWTCGFGCPTTR